MLVVAVIEPHVDEAFTHKEFDPEAGHEKEPIKPGLRQALHLPQERPNEDALIPPKSRS